MISERGWWRHTDALQRFVGDLVAGEIARARPGHAPLSLRDHAARFAEDLGSDSLERLQIATALAEAIHLQRSGIDDSLLAQPAFGDWLRTAAAALDRYSEELTFRTSGSTGQPKWCVHRLVDLQAEVELLVRVLRDCRRVFAVVPAHHIYGFLFTVLLPARLEITVVDLRAHTPAVFAQRLAPGDVIIGHPDFWRAFVRAAPRVAAGVTGVTSTGPCPPELARAVRAAGLERLVEVYGSSETAGIGWRDDPDTAYEVFGYWRRGATDVELIRTLPDGAERRLHVPDLLEWQDAYHVRPAGRREGAVQVGGSNVFPDRIAAVLCDHPDVRAAAVRLMNPAEGHRLKAFVVPQGAGIDTDALRADLWAWSDARLTAAERPKSIVFGSALPTGTFGKPGDWPVAHHAPLPDEPH